MELVYQRKLRLSQDIPNTKLLTILDVESQYRLSNTPEGFDGYNPAIQSLKKISTVCSSQKKLQIVKETFTELHRCIESQGISTPRLIFFI